MRVSLASVVFFISMVLLSWKLVIVRYRSLRTVKRMLLRLLRRDASASTQAEDLAAGAHDRLADILFGNRMQAAPAGSRAAASRSGRSVSLRSRYHRSDGEPSRRCGPMRTWNTATAPGLQQSHELAQVVALTPRW